MKKRSFRSTFVSVILVITVAISIVNLAVYGINIKKIRQVEVLKMKTAGERIDDMITISLNNIKGLKQICCTDNYARNILLKNNEKNDIGTKFENQNYMDNALKHIASMDTLILRATIVNKYGNIYCTDTSIPEEYVKTIRNMTKEWMLFEGKEDEYYYGGLQGDNANILTFLYPLHTYGNTPIALLAVDINYKTFQSILENAFYEDSGECFILTGEQELFHIGEDLYQKEEKGYIFDKSQKMMKENLIVDTFQSKGKNFYISSRQNMLSGWKIIQVIPEERLFEEVDQKIKWNSIFLLGALILVVSFSIYYTKKIIEPLEEFCKKISHTKGDQLQIINLEHMKLTREIANVIENYNEMANKMNEYLVREIIYDKNQRKIQSKMLRYQINPHFLYNTLNLIALVITDIQMQKMGGLELASYLHKHIPEIDVLILTAFENFDYAREALRYNVKDYIVKPIYKENLLPPVKKVLEKQEEKSRNQEKIKNYYQWEAAKNYFPVKTIVAHEELYKEFFSYNAIHQEEKFCIVVMQEEELVTDVELVNRIIQEKYRGFIKDFFFSKINEEYVMLLSGIECMDNELIVQEKVESMLSYFCTCKHMNITMGVGLVYSSKEKIYQSYNEALYALNQRLIQGWNRAYFYKNMDGYKARIGKEAEIKLESIVRTRKEKEINQVIHSILEDIIIKEESAQKLYMAVVEILKILGNYYAELYQDEDIEELKDIKVMFSRRYDLYKFKHIEELENYLKEMVIVICSGKENTKKKSKIVEEIVHYVENNYYKNISLRELAENKYFVNYSYCSRLFSQETGMNFSKYLIQYCLKKAKTLLENKDMKISFIAFEVGYNDVSHFIQSFKKSYGLTPEEYRARKKIE